MIRLIFNCFLLFSVSSPALAVWDLNDVSYLLPLPKKMGNDKLLRIDSNLDLIAKNKFLLDPKLYESLPRLTAELDHATTRKNLRVVAIRIDPCFPKPPPEACQKQIRLVWQILTVGQNEGVETVDAALHSFYTLTDDQFKKLRADLKSWKAKQLSSTAMEPLQIHPAWKDQLDQSPSLQEFQRIILNYVGPDNLSRITVMTVRNLGQTWGFVGADVIDQKLVVLEVPRVKSQAQIFINMANPADAFLGQINPVPISVGSPDDTINRTITNSQPLKSGNEDSIRAELQASLRIENPNLYNPNSMDCVSCHTAGPAKDWITNARTDLDLTAVFKTNAYQNEKFNLSHVTHRGNTQNIRAFGYFQNQPAISQRVINESAEVADFLNRTE